MSAAATPADLWQKVCRWEGAIEIKRVYEPPSPADGRRVLVDRLWPRGLSKERVQADAWIPEVAPSDELRGWFGHDPERWVAFAGRYHGELALNRELAGILAGQLQGERVTFLFAAKDEHHNNAAALKAFVETVRALGGPVAGAAQPEVGGAGGAGSGGEGTEERERVRRACIEAALRAYEDAGIRGLCAEGRWELAVDAMRNAELE